MAQQRLVETSLLPYCSDYRWWYLWSTGYWYPAWGYDSLNSYYPYDGPIYAYDGLAPDQVVANVQAALEVLGYYDGPINDAPKDQGNPRKLTPGLELVQLARQVLSTGSFGRTQIVVMAKVRTLR